MDETGRQFGKTYDLAFGFGGGKGAWRKFDSSDTYSDTEIENFKHQFRRTHRAILQFWHALERAAHRSVRSKRQHALSNRLCFDMEQNTLFMTLPSGRRLAYPEARRVPGKFEDSHNIRHKSNANGTWTDTDIWFGVLVENSVQAVARDLLVAAMQRLEAAGYKVVLHVHDEIVCEVPKDFGSEDEFRRLMLELPAWAAGLPIACKVRSGKRYAKSSSKRTPETATKIEPSQPQVNILENAEVAAASSQRTSDRPVGSSDEHNLADTEDDDNDEIGVSLVDLVNEELVDGKMRCPFHDDSTPSLKIYDDHFHCFGCGAHGDRVDWLMAVDGLSRADAVRLIKNWDGPIVSMQPSASDDVVMRACALCLWEEAQPIAGTLAIKYLADVRRIDVDALPANIDDVLRFHQHCPFNGTCHPCLLALMRNATTDVPTGIHRVALTPDARKIERRMLGQTGAVKIWPAEAQLVVGEGIETVLAAATRIPYRDAPLRPAWSLLSAGPLGNLPVIPGVERLIILVDHDLAGKNAALVCSERWTRASRTVVRLAPKRAGTDFNDLVMPEAVP